MKIQFSKYQGAGNDFIMLDGRSNVELTAAQIAKLCNRHFGIGADGLIILRKEKSSAYEMIYHNADGNVGSMCGNGARCSMMFAKEIGMINTDSIQFKACDGIHFGEMISENKVNVSMSDVNEIKRLDENIFETNTGSPHYIKFISGMTDFDIEKFGREIRYSDSYRTEGINVNVAEIISDGELRMRTYERGVEAETLACGTGTVAVALCYHKMKGLPGDENEITIYAPGGELKVFFTVRNNSYSSIRLQGSAVKVFSGEIEI